MSAIGIIDWLLDADVEHAVCVFFIVAAIGLGCVVAFTDDDGAVKAAACCAVCGAFLLTDLIGDAFLSERF